MTTPKTNATQLWRSEAGLVPLLTLGHGTLTGSQVAELAADAGVGIVVDVRRYPGSRRDPSVGREALATALAGAGVGYRWEERLGGRRHGSGSEANAALRNPSFRAYADYMQTESFTGGIAGLFDEREKRCAVLCSESVWWRCHRRLIADYATLAMDWPVFHLMHDGVARPHILTPEARRTPAGVEYPA